MLLLAISAACSSHSDAVGGWRSSDATSGSSPNSSSDSSSTGSTNSSSSTSTGPTTLTPSDPDGTASAQTPGESADDDPTETSGPSNALTDDTDISESELTSADGWAACDGDVPAACLEIFADVASCPGAAGSCTWHACVSDLNTRANIDWLECLADECGIEPVHDLDCLDAWADLTLECFRTECDPALPHACGLVNNGAQHECHQ